MFETAELFPATVFKARPARLTIRFPQPLLIGLSLIGAIGVIVPLVFPSEWFAPGVLCALILLLDPINALRGSPSITGDLARGDWRRLCSLLAGGFLCGLLWEFWNYWAL